MRQIFRLFTYFCNFKCSDSTFIAQSSIVTLILHTSLEGLVNAYAGDNNVIGIILILPCLVLVITIYNKDNDKQTS